jgi:ATP-dependent helicase/nuclease subunit B
METASPALWTIETGKNFAQTLTRGILKRYGEDPLALVNISLLLPNRRAVRIVQTAFMQAFDARAALLPRLMVLGEEPQDGLESPGGIDAAAIGEMERLALLTQLIDRWQAKQHITLCATPAHSVELAKSLARLLDQATTEGLDFDALAHLVPDEFAQHWQQVLTFLNIVTQAWPTLLAERGQKDAALLRRESLERQAAAWQAQPPGHAVIAAGSTGSIPATAHLLNVIARLPDGHVVLPGLEIDMPATIWDAVREGHPQGALKRLLHTMGAHRDDVKPWDDGAIDPVLKRRLMAIGSALRPAAHFHQAIQAHQPDSTIPGITLAEVEGEDIEAKVIALVLRETLETPEKTAALITPDRMLARRVAMQLKRWGIEIDDSAGQALRETPPAQFMRLVAAAVAEEWAPAPLLALMKHPFFHAGLARAEALSGARAIDLMLRGPRRMGGLSALRKACKNDAGKALLERLISHSESWPKLAASLQQHLQCHMALAQALSQSEGGAPLFEGYDGNALALWCDEAGTLSSGFGSITLDQYGALFDALMDGASVRSGMAKHPRLSILGTIEARMTQADVMVLGGLNEGTWPPAPAADPWMNEPMRVAFGLPPAERRIGLSAHDFVQACGGREVWLTRTLKTDGAPTLPSRWISRLKAAFGERLTTGAKHIAWAETLDLPAAYRPQPQPKPSPPLALRPRNLSVSDIERWMRDPYALYAKKVLRLEPLKLADEPPGAADRGSAIHDALEQFFKDAQTAWPENPHEALMRAGETAFAAWKDRPGVWALWWPRFEDLAHWVLKEHASLHAAGRTIAALETTGQRQFDVSGQPWIVRAKADRIDQDQNGLVILDYKTGSVPTRGAMEQGYAPQLPVEGLIAQTGGFKAPVATVSGFEYWSLSTTGSKPPQRSANFDAEALMKAAHDGLVALFHAFDQPEAAFLHAPSPMHAPYKDYDALARAEEWRDVPEAGAPGARRKGPAA